MIGRFSSLGVYRELLKARDFYIIVSAGLLALASFIIDHGKAEPSAAGNVLAIASVIINGFPIVWGALTGLFERQVNVDELVSIAIVASLVQGEYLAAAVVCFVMKAGSLIEQMTSESARKAIRSLIRISPETAVILENDDEKTVPVGEVNEGDIILVKPGDRVPVDALILSGRSAVDESSMTGEPLPVEKKEGDAILAGTLNHNGVLKARTTRVGQDTALGRIISLVTEAEQHRPESVRLIDRYARWFTPVILVCSALTFLLTKDVGRAVAVLIVGCPCALILAVPTATVAALGRAAKAGILVKGGQYLERIAAAQAVFFDKTGTLTLGEPRISEITCGEETNREKILYYAACAEQHVTHPLARAVLTAAQNENIVVTGAENAFHEIGTGVKATVDGIPVEVAGAASMENIDSFSPDLKDSMDRAVAQGDTPLAVIHDGKIVGILHVTDSVRPSAAAAIKKFNDLGIIETAVLSGDHERSVNRVAQSVGIRCIYPSLKPQDKMDIITRYQDNNLPVLFVGDGVNDAPALAAAHVGIAMADAGTDVALETADIALINDDISRLPWLIGLSRRMLVIIKLNIAFGLGFNALAVLASSMGFLSPIMAAIVHNFGSVLVVVASASLAFAPGPSGPDH